MKKLFLGLIAVMGMTFVTSCSDDRMDSGSDGNEMTVSFGLDVEHSLNSRAFSDGTGANTLVYQLFYADGTPVTEEPVVLSDVTFPYGDLSLRLVKGQAYQIAFWAQNSECGAYDTSDLTNVTVDYEGVNNDESRDAFFKTEKFTVTSDMKISSTLVRPFAQINVGVTDDDWNAAADMGFTKSQVIIEKAADTINLLTGAVSGETPVVYTASAMPASTSEKLTIKAVDGNVDYNYLSMSYILAPDVTTADGAQKTTLESLEFTFTNDGNDRVFVLKDGLNNVPVQRNWRTNIVGSFLTTDVDFEILIEPSYAGDNDYPDYAVIADGVSYDKAAKTFYISNANGLKWFADATNTPTAIKVNDNSPVSADQIKAIAGSSGVFAGQTIKLTADIDMAGVKFTPIQFTPSTNGLQATFDGCNHTISNLTCSTAVQGKRIGFIASSNGIVKNVKLDNAKITGVNYVGGVVGGAYGTTQNCHVTNSTLTANIDKTSNGEGADIGGIVGFLRDTNSNIEDCSVSNTVIKGSRDIGGIVGKYQGYANKNHITGCVLNDVQLIVNLPADYSEYDGKVYDRGTCGQAATFGPVAGYIMYNKVPSTNLDGSANADGNFLHNVDIVVADGRKAAEPVAVKSIAALAAVLQVGCKDVTLAPGEYKSLDPVYSSGNQRFVGFNSETTFNAKGVTFVGPLSPNFQGATVKGLAIKAPSADRNCIMGCFNGHFVDCSFVGKMYTESKDTPATLDNCTFYCQDVAGMAFHIGLLYAGNTVTLNNCSIDGRCDFGVAGNLVFNNCKLNVRANWEFYNVGTYTFNNCTITKAAGCDFVNKGTGSIVVK